MDELNNLTTIGTNSRRGGGQLSDLHHDVENQKFTVSDAIYAELELNDNGFMAHVGNGNVYISVQPNDESVSYKGRTGYDKATYFTSSTMSELMEKMDLKGDLNMEKVGEKDGKVFYKVTSVESINEEVAVENEEETIESEEVHV